MLNIENMQRDQDNLARTQSILELILTEAEALGVYLVDVDGFLVAETGDLDIDHVALAALISASFGATAEVARILGEANFDRMAQQGKDRHLFLGRAGNRHILVVVFDGNTNLGLVKLYAEQSLGDLAELLDTQQVVGDNQAASGAGPGAEEGTDSTLFKDWLDE